jgi:ribulose-phosphate 3-epimerase
MHFAVLDGRLAPKMSLGSTVVSSLRRRLPETVFDVRLSVAEPEHRVAEFVTAGADIISVHPESTMRLGAVLDDIRRRGGAVQVESSLPVA